MESRAERRACFISRERRENFSLQLFSGHCQDGDSLSLILFFPGFLCLLVFLCKNRGGIDAEEERQVILFSH